MLKMVYLVYVCKIIILDSDIMVMEIIIIMIMLVGFF